MPSRRASVSDLVEVARLVPRNVQRDARRAAGEPVDERCVFHLLAQRPRLARAGESSEARSARGERPRGQRDLEALDGGDHLVGVPASALQPISQRGEVALVIAFRGGIELDRDRSDVGGGHAAMCE